MAHLQVDHLNSPEYLARITCHWNGFRASLLDMKRGGWSITCDLDPWKDGVHFTFRHNRDPRGRGAILIAALLPYTHLMDRRYPISLDLRIEETIMDNDVIRVHSVTQSTWRTKDHFADIPRPFTSSYQEVAAVDYYGFLKMDDPAPTQGIIVGPENIEDVLKLIKKAQAPEQEQIRERARRNEVQLRMPAQVLTLDV